MRWFISPSQNGGWPLRDADRPPPRPRRPHPLQRRDAPAPLRPLISDGKWVSDYSRNLSWFWLNIFYATGRIWWTRSRGGSSALSACIKRRDRGKSRSWWARAWLLYSYRELHQLANVGWVDFVDLGSSDVCPTLLRQWAEWIFGVCKLGFSKTLFLLCSSPRWHTTSVCSRCPTNAERGSFPRSRSSTPAWRGWVQSFSEYNKVRGLQDLRPHRWSTFKIV